MNTNETSKTLANYRQSPDPDCPSCGGKGLIDSGGVTPWDQPVYVRCDCTFPKPDPNCDQCGGTGTVTTPTGFDNLTEVRCECTYADPNGER